MHSLCSTRYLMILVLRQIVSIMSFISYCLTSFSWTQSVSGTESKTLDSVSLARAIQQVLQTIDTLQSLDQFFLEINGSRSSYVGEALVDNQTWNIERARFEYFNCSPSDKRLIMPKQSSNNMSEKPWYNTHTQFSRIRECWFYCFFSKELPVQVLDEGRNTYEDWSKLRAAGFRSYHC